MDNNAQVLMIDIDSIIPNRFQPRLTFDETELNNLANSIKEHGIIQPLVLRRLNDKYEIIAGERRYKAAQLAGLTHVPAIIKDFDDNESAEVALVENVQRKNLNAMEEAKSYKKLLDRGNLTQDALAKKMGISQPSLANKLRLLNLTPEVQDALMNNKISERHARSLLLVKDSQKQVELLNRVINERLTVRVLDQIIKESENKKEELGMNNEVLNLESNELNNASNNIFDINAVNEPIFSNPKVVTPPINPIDFNPFVNAPVNENIIPSNNEVKDEEIETLETLDDIINESDNNEVTSSFNSFINSFSGPAYPSLEDEQVNMNMDNTDTFTPFNMNYAEDLPVKEEIIETIDDVNEDLKEVVVPEKIVKPGNINSIKVAFNNLKKEIEEAGFKIATEEFDFEDIFQLIIKIDKPKDDN